jgi:adenine-specific DNA-methyltransferase
LDIPRQFLKPILPGPRHLEQDIVSALPDGKPQVSPQLYLLDCNEPETVIRNSWPRFYQYLQHGRDQNIHSSYITSRRDPWYSQEKRPPAPFLCTYMGRSISGKNPLRFVWNRSQATARNVYLMLYPRGGLRDVLILHPEMESSVFQALRSITPAQMLAEGRVYGGGLHKVEPKELARIPARSILENLGLSVVIERQTHLFL